MADCVGAIYPATNEDKDGKEDKSRKDNDDWGINGFIETGKHKNLVSAV